MPFTEEEIKKYLDILCSYTKPPEKTDRKISCSNCQEKEFDLVAGYVFCMKCVLKMAVILIHLIKETKIGYFLEKKAFISASIILKRKSNKFLKDLNLLKMRNTVCIQNFWK